MRRDTWGMRSLFLVTLLSLVALAGCASGAGAKASVKAPPTATATSMPPTQTPVPATATPSSPTVVSQVSFTCPATVNGSSKTFSDARTGFSFSYPVSWTETEQEPFSRWAPTVTVPPAGVNRKALSSRL